MIRTSALLLALGLAAAVLPACDAAAPETSALVQFDGFVVTYTAVEGGAWLLQDSAGTRYVPTNLDPSFQEEGLRVRVEGRVLEGYVTTIQVGDVFEIASIRRL